MMSKIRIGFAVAMVGALAACHSGVKLDEGANKGAIGTQPDANAVQQVNVDPLNDPNSPLAKRSIYFDFDSYAVRDDYQPLLQQHAQYLKSHPDRHVLIQGTPTNAARASTTWRWARSVLKLCVAPCHCWAWLIRRWKP